MQNSTKTAIKVAVVAAALSVAVVVSILGVGNFASQPRIITTTK